MKGKKQIAFGGNLADRENDPGFGNYDEAMQFPLALLDVPKTTRGDLLYGQGGFFAQSGGNGQLFSVWRSGGVDRAGSGAVLIRVRWRIN